MRAPGWSVHPGAAHRTVGGLRCARGWDHVAERRFKVLLKFDLFAKDWKMVAADTGKRTEDLRSNNAGQNLQALQLGTR